LYGSEAIKLAIILEKQRVVLQFEKAVFTTIYRGAGETDALDLDVCAGDFFLIRPARLEHLSTIADAVAGLTRPIRGAVYLLGMDWQALSPDQANALRGRIGRVFTAGNWISHLSLMENILLPQLHHTRRSVSEMCAEAAVLAEQFGLPGIPVGLPGDFLTTDLQRAAWVRAFMGRPALVLLEEPATGMNSEAVSGLINVIRTARDRGAAVLWLTREDMIWRDPSLPVTYRYRLDAGKLRKVTM
jgi:phospholipid/cholesterol/gamma-HCH transport system ATP-binding protein